MKKIYSIVLAIFALTSFAASMDVKNIFVTTSYKIVSNDSDALLNVTSPSNTLVRIIVPLETGNKDTFQTGTKIYGNSLTDGTILVSGDDGVTIINPDNAFRTKRLGSQWTLTKIRRNMWLLSGDLYSTEIDAYVGDDITIRANVDPAATGPFVFTWFKDNVVILDQNNASLKLTNLSLADSGNYRVEVKNSVGYASSEVTNLLVR